MKNSSVPIGFPLAHIATGKDGSQIEHLRWLPDSCGMSFMAINKGTRGNFHRLFAAIKALTPEDQHVGDFDIRSDSSNVYEISATAQLIAPKDDEQPARVLTGQSIWDMKSVLCR